MKFKEVKKEFLEFLELEKGYSAKTIEAYQRDILKFEIFLTEFSIDFKINFGRILTIVHLFYLQINSEIHKYGTYQLSNLKSDVTILNSPVGCSSQYSIGCSVPSDVPK